MGWFDQMLKTGTFKAALVGAFGGMALRLIELIEMVFKNQFPGWMYLVGMLLLALLGLVTVLIYQETDLKKALALGAGAPALIAGLVSPVVAPEASGVAARLVNPFHSAVYASPPPSRLELLVEKNESPFRLSALWIRADETTLAYQIEGSRVILEVPEGTNQVRLDFPSQTTGLMLYRADLQGPQPVDIRIVTTNVGQGTKDFWQAFSGRRVAAYRIERGGT
jgi:hypothetical protein